MCVTCGMESKSGIIRDDKFRTCRTHNALAGEALQTSCSTSQNKSTKARCHSTTQRRKRHPMFPLPKLRKRVTQSLSSCSAMQGLFRSLSKHPSSTLHTLQILKTHFPSGKNDGSMSLRKQLLITVTPTNSQTLVTTKIFAYKYLRSHIGKRKPVEKLAIEWKCYTTSHKIAAQYVVQVVHILAS